MSESDDFVVTKSSASKKGCAKEFQCVVYESYKSKNRSEESRLENGNHQTDKLDVNKITHEVFKFGIARMNPEEKREAKKKLAIKLGAKPPSNTYVNYKSLVKQRQIEKEQQRLDQLYKEQADDPLLPFQNATLNKKKKPTRQERRRNNILEAYGKPGQVTKKKKKKRRK